ncbi:MAG: hypothetical protein FWE44_03525 [Defluviitaleaceae bacterium]|nr:hypothetical protein [Defluviitaleaceae bacterium]
MHLTKHNLQRAANSRPYVQTQGINVGAVFNRPLQLATYQTQLTMDAIVGAATCRPPRLRLAGAFDKAQASAGGYKPPLRTNRTNARYKCRGGPAHKVRK